MAIVQDVSRSIIEPLQSIWDGMISVLPGILGALIVLAIGYIIGTLIEKLVENLLNKLKVERWLLQQTNIASVLGYFRLSRFLGLLSKWYVFILFIPPAASIIQLTPLAYFLLDFARWVPRVIAGIVIALVGLMAGDYLDNKIRETRAKAAELIGSTAKVLVVLFTMLLVLDQIGIRIAIAQTSFLIILAGIMLGVALMLGIGFGLAFKDDAKGIIRNVKRKL